MILYVSTTVYIMQFLATKQKVFDGDIDPLFKRSPKPSVFLLKGVSSPPNKHLYNFSPFFSFFLHNCPNFNGSASSQALRRGPWSRPLTEPAGRTQKFNNFETKI